MAGSWRAGLLLVTFLMAALAGCAADPVSHSERLAAAAGASRALMRGDGFEHVVFSHGLSPAASQLHIYVGGDGRAFLSRHRVAADPTPGRPLALQLMLADPAPAAYVARPCYHGTAAAAGCRPELWTSGRYSTAVVASMAAVVGELVAQAPQADVTLIGYSGGGVVALLTAARVARVTLVVTLAAPLDLEAWTAAHDYTPLFDSVDPATLSGWPPGLRQIHVHGARDGNVAPALVDGFRRALESEHASASFRVMDGFDHVCCWREFWPGLLDDLTAGHWPPARAKL